MGGTPNHVDFDHDSNEADRSLIELHSSKETRNLGGSEGDGDADSVEMDDGTGGPRSRIQTGGSTSSTATSNFDLTTLTDREILLQLVTSIESVAGMMKSFVTSCHRRDEVSTKFHSTSVFGSLD